MVDHSEANVRRYSSTMACWRRAPAGGYGCGGGAGWSGEKGVRAACALAVIRTLPGFRDQVLPGLDAAMERTPSIAILLDIHALLINPRTRRRAFRSRKQATLL